MGGRRAGRNQLKWGGAGCLYGSRVKSIVGASLLALTALLAPAALGDDADLDPTFAYDGTVDVSIGVASTVRAVSVDARGRYLVAGETRESLEAPVQVFVTGYLRSGAVDFLTKTDRLPQEGSTRDMVVDDQGRILVLAGPAAGLPNSGGFWLRRFRPDGSVDGSFGNFGVVELADPRSARIAFDQSGRIVLAGRTREGTNIAVVRLLPSGELDNDFADNGRFVLLGPGETCPGDTRSSAATAVTTDAVDRIAIGSRSSSSNSGCDEYQTHVLRLTVDGRLDPSFGQEGVADYQGSFEDIDDLSIDNSQRVVVLATICRGCRGGPTHVRVNRLLSNGTPDSSFISFAPSQSFEASALALDARERIVFAGSYSADSMSSLQPMVARLRPNGTPDLGFNGRSFFVTPSIGGFSAVDLASDPGGGVVIVGLGAIARLGAPCQGLGAMVGTRGADQLRGTKLPDVILARGGKDQVHGGRGGDFVCTGPGADRVGGGPGADWIELGGDDDVARGGSGSDRLSGGGGADRLFGDGGGDRLLGGFGPDLLRGGDGRDRLAGGPGRDELRQ